MFPIFIIILFSFNGSSHTKIAEFPDEIEAFSFLITFDFTKTESPIFAENDEKIQLSFL